MKIKKTKNSVVIARLTTISTSMSILLEGQADYFRSRGYTVHLASGPGSYSINDEFYTQLPLVRRPSIFIDLYALIKTYLWLRKVKPDIMHTHTPKAGLIGMISAYLACVPVRIHTVAGLPWINATGIKRYVYRTLEAFTYLLCTRVYPNSLGLHKFLANEIPQAIVKYKVLGNGSSNGINFEYFSVESIPESKHELRELYSLPKESFIWLFIGRIVTDKGINELIRAFLEMESNHLLLLVGPFEDDHDPISTQTRTIIETSKRIITFGFQKDVRPFLKMSDALVFPSHREGFPNVPLQAAAMGIPQIVSNINGCNEIVSHGVNGLLVPPKEVDALSLAMTKLSKNETLLKKLSTNARSSVYDKFSRVKVWQLIESEYESLYHNY